MSEETKILLVCISRHVDTRAGAGQRTSLIHRSLQEIGEVDTAVLCAPNMDINDIETSDIRNGKIIHLPYLSRKHRQDCGIDWQSYDVVVFRYINSFFRSGSPNHPRAVLDIDDLPWHSYSFAKSVNLPKLIRNARNTLRDYMEFMLYKDRFRSFLVAKESDLKWTYGRGSVVPNIPFLDDTFPEYQSVPKTKNIACVALWLHPPNELGMRWFLRNCWHLIKSACKDCSLTLAGTISDTLRKERRKYPDVHILGRIDDLSAVYSDSRLTIAPIFSGGGSNIKVLETLARSRPVVLTDHALRGYEHSLMNEDSVLSASEPVKFSRNVIRLLTDDCLCERLSRNGYDIVRTQFSYERFSSTVRGAVENVLGEHVEVPPG